MLCFVHVSVSGSALDFTTPILIDLHACVLGVALVLSYLQGVSLLMRTTSGLTTVSKWWDLLFHLAEACTYQCCPLQCGAHRDNSGY